MSHKETPASTLAYLLKFSVIPHFSAVSCQISYARVCFQGIHMKASGFLNLIFQHRAPHIPEAVVATYGAVPPSPLPTPVKSMFSGLFSLLIFSLAMNSYLCLLEFPSFHFSEKRHILWELIRQFRNLNICLSASHLMYHRDETFPQQ